ncbi:MAG: T9SS C-terminal target domain-containing protein [Bacteroidota bacterium]
MKRIILSVLVLAVFGLSSCLKVNFEEYITNNNGGSSAATDSQDPATNGGVIQGILTKDYFLPKGKYTLKGYVYVTEGNTLTIAPGSVIVSDITEKGALIIERGAKLIADGRADNPIVFTSGKPIGQRTPGDWGGIIMLGKAPTNRPLDPAPIIEGGVGRKYGGTDPNDDSGILRFVRIEFAGIAAEPGSEINGLTLGGVGSGTIIENVQVSFGNDDAFEFFGGTVNCKNLIAFATADDDFDFDFGYVGKIQFGIACRKPDFVDGGDAGNGIECDNDGSGSAATPTTRPQLSNFTFVGPNGASGTAANHNFGNRWRRATQFVLRNSVMIGWAKAGFSLESKATAEAYLSGASEYRNNLIHSNTSSANYRGDAAAIAVITADAMKTKAESEGCITLASADDAKLTSPYYSTAPNFIPATGSPALTGASFTGMNAFFTTVAYRGAIGTTNWTDKWTNWDPQNKAY